MPGFFGNQETLQKTIDAFCSLPGNNESRRAYSSRNAYSSDPPNVAYSSRNAYSSDPPNVRPASPSSSVPNTPLPARVARTHAAKMARFSHSGVRSSGCLA